MILLSIPTGFDAPSGQGSGQTCVGALFSSYACICVQAKGSQCVETGPREMSGRSGKRLKPQWKDGEEIEAEDLETGPAGKQAQPAMGTKQGDLCGLFFFFFVSVGAFVFRFVELIFGDELAVRSLKENNNNNNNKAKQRSPMA